MMMGSLKTVELIEAVLLCLRPNRFPTQLCTNLFGTKKAKAVEVLWIAKEILLDLCSFPFKSRRASIDSVLNNPKFQKLLPSFHSLLDALSLEKKVFVRDCNINIRWNSNIKIGRTK
ncbi:unnamed protein product [Vicia faba]|uniref:Uncharacterized protein n=1 Tax=Vicia faba TaxID=3906 RepID=A0AAV0YMA0_VICFA|nr:unnamed protein product [Vicia faba]